MFESFHYTYPAVIPRHHKAPLAVEREVYLTESAARSLKRATLLHIQREGLLDLPRPTQTRPLRRPTDYGGLGPAPIHAILDWRTSARCAWSRCIPAIPPAILGPSTSRTTTCRARRPCPVPTGESTRTPPKARPRPYSAFVLPLRRSPHAIRSSAGTMPLTRATSPRS